MKNNYLTPQIEVITIDDNFLLAGSIRDQGSYASDADAPAMMNIPEEESYSEHEE